MFEFAFLKGPPMSVTFTEMVPVCIACSSAEDELNVFCFGEDSIVFLVSVVGDLIAPSWDEVGVAFNVGFDSVC